LLQFEPDFSVRFQRDAFFARAIGGILHHRELRLGRGLAGEVVVLPIIGIALGLDRDDVPAFAKDLIGIGLSEQLPFKLPAIRSGACARSIGRDERGRYSRSEPWR
jgi:hypothetical protein